MRRYTHLLPAGPRADAALFAAVGAAAFWLAERRAARAAASRGAPPEATLAELLWRRACAVRASVVGLSP